MKVRVLSIGQVDPECLSFIENGLRETIPEVEVESVDRVMPVPQETYNPSRRQYHSTQILTKMKGFVDIGENEHVLGVTEVDLYAPWLNFVFGEAQPAGRVAIISLFRLRPEFYGEKPNSHLFHERALKEAVHELGHTFGLGHCENTFCVMFFSNSIVDTDRKMARFCDDCHVLVHRVLEK